MTRHATRDLAAQIIEKAKYFGASLAGVASVDLLKTSPSQLIYAKLDDYQTVANSDGDIKLGEVNWPDNAKSAIVIAVEHAAGQPELDWWQPGCSGGTTGNQILISVNLALSEWLETEKKIKTNPLPYHVEKGGIFNRMLCNQQMKLDQDKGVEILVEGQDITASVVQYCRQCEFACPVGR
jgi:epoxyqueuosine reductase